MDYIDGFVSECKARGMTDHTIETYRSNVQAFLRAYTKPAEVSLDDLRHYLGDLRARELQDPR